MVVFRQDQHQLTLALICRDEHTNTKELLNISESEYQKEKAQP